MELTAEEWYVPSIDALGTYIDRIPKTEMSLWDKAKNLYEATIFNAYQSTVSSKMVGFLK